jgi:tRNA nucleotidyltransferase/poly(A) polymerase
VTRLGFGGLILLLSCYPLRAQTPAVDELKGRIFDAHMAEQLLAGGLKYCAELDGTNFYFAPRNRVLNLEEYHRSLENLASAQAFNPQTRRPWTAQDAENRWQEVKKQALGNKESCALVASLPDLEKRLQELQGAAAGVQH